MNKLTYKGIEVIEIEDGVGGKISFSPERGGILTSCIIDGKEIFYMDQSTFENKEKPVRGGNPFLFPTCGKLADGTTKFLGKEYQIPPHGFARDMAFEVVSIDEDTCSVVLALTSNVETKKFYPFDFRAELQYQLTGNCLTVNQKYINMSQTAMPVQIGFHTYFKCGQKDKVSFKSGFDRNADMIKGGEAPFSGAIDDIDNEYCRLLLKNGTKEITMTSPDISHTIRIKMSEEFNYIMLWALPGQQFICIEPWTAKLNSMNTGEDIINIAPGKTLETKFEIYSE